MPAGLIGVMGEIAGAAAALAGLILVFMGATAAAYERFEGQGQKLVRPKYRKRVWLAFGGLCAALLSTALAIFAKADSAECAGWIAVGLLALAALAVLGAALLSALEIG